MSEEGEATPLIEGGSQGVEKPSKPTLIRQCAAEFVATALFVFIGTTVVATGEDLLIALAHGLAITLLISGFGDISGGHINPAVTLGVWLSGGAMHWYSVIGYVVSQLLGGLLGAALNRGVLSYSVAHAIAAVGNATGDGNETEAITVYESIKGGSHVLAQGIDPAQAILFEALLTFILVLTVLLTAVEKNSNSHLAPVAIGLAVFVGIAAACNITGGSMNPARSFGPALILHDKIEGPLDDNHYIYWLGPVIGSIVAVIFYRAIFAGPQKRMYAREDE